MSTKALDPDFLGATHTQPVVTEACVTVSCMGEQSHPGSIKEPYFQPGQHEMMEANNERKKCLTESRFRYASPMKQSSSVGDNFGAFDKLTYKEPFDVVKTGDPPREVKEVPPNIKCNPAKKGSYGNNWGKLLGPEFPYVPESAEDKKKQITADRLAHYAKLGDRNAFKANFPPVDFFDSHPHVAASKVYTWMPEPPAKDAPAKAEDDRKPFYPSAVPHKGYNSTMNKFPAYQTDNFEDVLKAQRAAAAAERERLEVRGAFKASMRAKSLPVVPVMTHPLNVMHSASMSLPTGTTGTMPTPV